ncbi:chaoptin [Nilaparvata lugens]|uniref:chaoptin n=1 Tax=Nilaparvata lugens TaxID=108931 RepID=UPI000B98A934|nr:chaoptin [Nilaparvata lugens]XP_039277766.1 chaoptin [Nilaparvata lugens]
MRPLGRWMLGTVHMLVVGLVGFVGWVGAQEVVSCRFNSMCLCKAVAEPIDKGVRYPHDNSPHHLRDVSCYQVPFSKFPELPHGHIPHVDVMGCDLEAVDNEALGGTQVDALRLFNNKLLTIGEKAFTTMNNVLRALDLGSNELQEIPIQALLSLKKLDWLNLQRNHISSILEIDWGHLKNSLANLLIAENDIEELPSVALTEFRHLALISLNNNKLRLVKPGALPTSLKTLGLSHNSLSIFPAEAIDELKDLQKVFLRGNYIEALPSHSFTRLRKLDKLDLGENALETIPSSIFNESLVVRDLNLDFNAIKNISANAFRGMHCERIQLSINKINHVDEKAFAGLESSLGVLYMENNNLKEIPKALSHLKRLKSLYISSNKIREIGEDAFDGFSSVLKAISLAGNHLLEIPKLALKNCKRISHFNIGYNQITDVTDADFEGWGESLETLILRNNRIVHLHPHMFKHTPRLKELSLSFNRISDAPPDTFLDVANTLELVEISFGLYQEEFPEDLLKPLSALIWLDLDNNNIRGISKTALYNFGQLQYFNMDMNKLTYLPEGLFHANVHRNLRDIRLSYNYINSIESDTFYALEKVQTISLAGNNIQEIKSQSFKNLPNLVKVVLIDNRIHTIRRHAFYDLPSLVQLDLQDNDLVELSLNIFENVTTFNLPMLLNVSKNQITDLYPSDTNTPIYVNTLDISRNLIGEVPTTFLQTFSDSIRILHLGYNRINRLETSAFGELSLLEVLTLEHNSIVTLRKRAFSGLLKLQILDLSHNHIEQLQMEQFKTLENLRIVSLAFNHIRSLPRDAFQKTRLEKIDLSNNEFVGMPSNSLGEVGFTLRHLDISYNHIEHLDSTMFSEMPFLTSLNLNHNKLTILPDNVFSRLSGLLKLNIASNPLRANFKELFHYVQKLRYLNLAETGLRQAPILPLPNLIQLNLSSNFIRDVPAAAFEGLQGLRHLIFSRNKLQSAPSQAWIHTPLLKILDLSVNPIKMLTKESFIGLERLQELYVHDLPRLERFDSDTMSGMRHLFHLSIQTWPSIERYRFRLGSTLSTMPSLRHLQVKIYETVLTDQLVGAFNPKLTTIDISGYNLKHIDGKAFIGIEDNSELVLRIHDTQIEELPPGLYTKLSKIINLSLDLRNNRFTSLSYTALYTNTTRWEDVGTKLISGGLKLAGNPWECECGLVWAGHWLRRWLREPKQIQLLSVEAGRQLVEEAREATCRDPRTRSSRPLLHLTPEDLRCQASALSSAAATVSCTLLRLSLFLALLPHGW